MSKQVQYWAYYKVFFHSITKDVWGELDTEIPPYFEKEMDSHITIHPRYQFPEEEKPRFEHYIYKHFPKKIQLDVNGFYYHPETHKPMVVCFDINIHNIDFKQKQYSLCSDIANNGGRNVIDPRPVKPHITLYKSKDRSKAGHRKIPSNAHKIVDKCSKLEQQKLPITVKDTRLVIEKQI